VEPGLKFPIRHRPFPRRGAGTVPTFQPADVSPTARRFGGPDSAWVISKPSWFELMAERSRSKARSGAHSYPFHRISRGHLRSPGESCGSAWGLPDSGGDLSKGDPPDGQRQLSAMGPKLDWAEEADRRVSIMASLVDGKNPGPRDGRCPHPPVGGLSLRHSGDSAHRA